MNEVINSTSDHFTSIGIMMIGGGSRHHSSWSQSGRFKDVLLSLVRNPDHLCVSCFWRSEPSFNDPLLLSLLFVPSHSRSRSITYGVCTSVFRVLGRSVSSIMKPRTPLQDLQGRPRLTVLQNRIRDLVLDTYIQVRHRILKTHRILVHGIFNKTSSYIHLFGSSIRKGLPAGIARRLQSRSSQMILFNFLENFSSKNTVQTRRFASSTQIITSQHKGL